MNATPRWYASGSSALVILIGPVGLLMGSGCGQGSSPTPRLIQDDQNEESRRAEIAHRSQEATRRALLAEFDLSNARFDEDDLLHGGPAKDGIPALVNPQRIPASNAEYPAPDGRVAVVSIGEQAVAYPLGILNWHEIANDVVGGVPVAVNRSR